MAITEYQRRSMAELYATAGKRYGRLATELADAWAELLGVGMVASNRHVAAIEEHERLTGVALHIPHLAPFLAPINTDVLRQRAHQRADELHKSLEL